jgi:hypothetical protein
VFKFLGVVLFCLFLLAFFAIVRRRAGGLAATLLVLLIGLSPIYIGGTDTVLSDIPYLCFVGVTLWWMDRCRLGGGLRAPSSRAQFVIMGLLLAFSFNIRREGIFLLFAFAALHLSALAAPAEGSRWVNVLREVDWRKASVPYATFGLAVVAFHLLLPTMLAQRIPGTGFGNVPARLDYYQGILAEQVGLQNPGSPVQLFGSEHMGAPGPRQPRGLGRYRLDPQPAVPVAGGRRAGHLPELLGPAHVDLVDPGAPALLRRHTVPGLLRLPGPAHADPVRQRR